MNLNWELLYREHVPRIYNFFRYRLGDDMLAEDLTATTFERAWRFRENYRDDLGEFSQWLFVIARNVANDYFRSRKQREVALDDIAPIADGTELETEIQRRREFARLSTAIARLALREQELIALKYGAELTNRKIASITGLSESNVGTILSRVVKRLRLELEVENAE